MFHVRLRRRTGISADRWCWPCCSSVRGSSRRSAAASVAPLAEFRGATHEFKNSLEREVELEELRGVKTDLDSVSREITENGRETTATMSRCDGDAIGCRGRPRRTAPPMARALETLTAACRCSSTSTSCGRGCSGSCRLRGHLRRLLVLCRPDAGLSAAADQGSTCSRVATSSSST